MSRTSVVVNSITGTSTVENFTAAEEAAADVAGGISHTCGVLAGGGVKCWGYNGLGSIGDTTTTQSRLPVSVSVLSGAQKIAAGR